MRRRPECVSISRHQQSVPYLKKLPDICSCLMIP
jgi:hypothetical protein